MKSVPVFFQHLLVGTVEVSPDGELSFIYSKDWQNTRGAFPISMSMPLGTDTHPSSVISPWLANLLPEEEQLDVLSRSLGMSQSDALGLLAEIGGDTAGALSFGEPSAPERWRYTPLMTLYDVEDPKEALERHFKDLALRPFLAGEEGVRLSLAGGQKKTALAVLDSEGTPVLRLPQEGDQLAVPQEGAPSTLIIKPDNPRLPGITENEVYCLKLAKAIGIPSAEASIIATADRTAICVLRYDRRVTRGGNLLRIHQEDFAQTNALPPGRKYEHGTIPGLSLHEILSTGRRLGPKGTLALLDQVIFNILVANTDSHAKNYSLLLPLNGKPELSPLYDVSTVLPWPGVVQRFAQKIAGRRRSPTDIAPRDWRVISETSGFRPAGVLERVELLVDRMVASRVPVSREVASFPRATAGYIEEAAEMIENNAVRLLGRLPS